MDILGDEMFNIGAGGEMRAIQAFGFKVPKKFSMAALS